jgi:formyl-CoA transferase
MLSVIRLMAQYLEHGKAQRTSMPNGVYTTADGQLNITMVRPGDWPLFCDAIEHPDLEHEPRFATHAARGDNLDELYEVVRPIIATKPTERLAARLTERGIMNGKVNTYRQFLTEEQVAAAGIIAWLKQPGVPEPVPMPNIPGLPPLESGTRRAHAPVLGEHTLEVLAQHGYSEPEIAALLEQKVVSAPGR